MDDVSNPTKPTKPSWILMKISQKLQLVVVSNLTKPYHTNPNQLHIFSKIAKTNQILMKFQMDVFSNHTQPKNLTKPTLNLL